MRSWHKLFIAALLVAIPTIGMVRGHAADTRPQRWLRFHESGQTVVIKPTCLDAEDTAAHLRLLKYEDGKAVYGCEHSGY